MEKKVKPGRRFKIKPELYQKIYDDFEKGKTLKVLASEYDCSEGTISRILRRVRESG